MKYLFKILVVLIFSMPFGLSAQFGTPIPSPVPGDINIEVDTPEEPPPEQPAPIGFGEELSGCEESDIFNGGDLSLTNVSFSLANYTYHEGVFSYEIQMKGDVNNNDPSNATAIDETMPIEVSVFGSGLWKDAPSSSSSICRVRDVPIYAWTDLFTFTMSITVNIPVERISDAMAEEILSNSTPQLPLNIPISLSLKVDNNNKFAENLEWNNTIQCTGFTFSGQDESSYDSTFDSPDRKVCIGTASMPLLAKLWADLRIGLRESALDDLTSKETSTSSKGPFILKQQPVIDSETESRPYKGKDSSTKPRGESTKTTSESTETSPKK